MEPLTWRRRTRPIALDVGAPAALEPDMQAYFAKCKEKLGFVPNVLQAYAFDNAKLRAFILMVDDLMLGDSGLSKLEREMIAVAVSSVNHCHYCLTAHGAAVRQRAKRPGDGRADRPELSRRRPAAAPEGDARLRRQAHRGARQDRGGGPRGAAPRRLQRSRHLGHRRRRRLLQHVEPHGRGRRHAAQPRVPLHGPRARPSGEARQRPTGRRTSPPSARATAAAARRRRGRASDRFRPIIAARP